MSHSAWRQASDRLCHHLSAWSIFTQAQTILAYVSVRQEPDVLSLVQPTQQWGLPRCVNQVLVWHQWTPAAPLSANAYGIPEPSPDAPLISPEKVDLILVPAIACDQQGYRLGYGGGFYDRMLQSPVWAAKPTIGIVFEQGRLPSLPRDPWDQPLTGLCTEMGLFLVDRANGEIGPA